MITQRMIAALAGVERSTVSLALRGDARIPEGTRARVRSAAERLGYRPHPVLSELASRRWRAGGAKVREQLAFLRTVAEEHPMAGPARRRAEQLGYGFVVLDPRAAASPRRLAEVLKARAIRGILIEQDTRQDDFGALDWSGFVAVQCGLLQRVRGIDLVAVDLLGMVNEAVERARAAGARRVGFLLPSQDLARSDLLLRQAVAGRAKEARLLMAAPTPVSPGAILEALRGLRRDGADFVVATDAAHLRAHRKVFGEEAGFAALFRKPEEARVTGFAAHEPLVATEAVELLVAKLRAGAYGAPAVRRSVQLLPPWIEGETGQRAATGGTPPPARSSAPAGRRGAG